MLSFMVGAAEAFYTRLCNEALLHFACIGCEKGDRMVHKYRISKATSLVLVGILLLLHACNQAPEVTDDDITLIDDVKLVELLQENPKLMIIDVRPDYRYRLSHIPNAVNIPLPELSADDPRFAEVEHVVVYGDGPRNTLSQAAAKKLLAGGKIIVSDFRGGMDLWDRSSRKTETSH